MSARLLDGKALAARVRGELADQVRGLARAPGLAVVLVGEDPASRVYVRNKARAAEAMGLVHRQIDLPADTTQARLLEVVRALGDDPAIDGILVQFPLPPHLSQAAVLDAIPVAKDVDGLTTASLGLLAQGRPGLVACTPKGCMRLLDEAGAVLEGAHAVVVGRSNIVGRPMAMLLEQANATVTVCHSRTRDLPAVCRTADILVVGVGRPELVRADWVAPGAVVIDVGINRKADGRLCGDVATDEVAEVASAVTPVPGGVGPMTIAMLLANTVESALARGA
ncbi:MAG: bifunctional methylenetetrahydrofolate dehydrogenase/methenyltetrahydrofolate cyclohydrolase FolD [Alphaproteobacteria bacterium]|nr:bifunctional methylenetetrahydrofolate dehydrogenase/methenyltetrahydrofolate cyclohydrolase FolD [Alphaproteobacteria bacterium]